MKVDEIDYEILKCLRGDSQLSMKDLAKKIGIHNNTLLQRIKRLEKSGVITKYSASVDYSKVGYDLTVVMMMKVKKGRSSYSAQDFDNIVKLKELEAFYSTTGIWDLVAILRVKNREHLNEVIQKVSTNPIVTKTASSIVLYPFKDPDQFNPFK
ncbi:Lrp/AsnC family transcriptional regulator [Candidatus Micrarchaeota archaeon]|nr:Lrp/AsnC family transcriptional regulator [Candidatus Micrarchaeota archaeon]